MSPEREPAAVLYDLLTASTFISFYDDTTKVGEFVGSAINSIPGVISCTVEFHDSDPDEEYNTLRSNELERPAQSYVLEIRSAHRLYGRIMIKTDDSGRFLQYESAVHNFSNTLALRVENLKQKENLERQVRRQTKALELNQAFLESIFESTGDAMTVFDPAYNVVRANHAAEYLRTELAHTATDATDPHPSTTHASTEDGPHRRSTFFCFDQNHDECPLRKAFETGTTYTTIKPFPTGESQQWWFAISVFPITDSTGRVVNVIESGRDITELKNIQDKLSTTLEEKDLLIREVHHRVKNNLNMVISLLNLQFSQFDDPRIEEALTASVERIHSMALVHQFLHQSDTSRSIDLQGFLQPLVDELAGNHVTGTPLQIHTTIADTQIQADVAIPLSIIINELVTNSLKYAFSDHHPGTIDIRCRKTSENTIDLTVSDDGVGLPEGFDIDESDSLGMRLIQGLTQQIGGTVEMSPRLPGASRRGLVCSISIPIARTA